MKRARAFIIVLVFMCLLLYEAFSDGQNDISNHDVSDKVEQNVEEEAVQEDVVQEEVVQEVLPNTENKPEVNTQDSTQKDVASQKTEGQNQVVPQETSTSQQTTTSTQMNEVKETPTEKINAGTVNVAAHTPIAEQDYYQYHSLNDLEKTIYQAIVQEIKASNTFVNLSKYSCSHNTLSKIYECIMADYPQFFYLAKNSSYTCDSTGKNVKQLILMYTDGTTTDQYNERGERIVTANRSTISEQVRNFQAKISEVLTTIPASSSELEKEKIIYEFLQSHVTYDTQAATLVYSPEGTQIPHAFDVYGALCEGKAVCEGYAKLFQYLCYCVGIQVTQIYGSSSNQPHMWNAVKIQNEWYMSDATWDDSGRDELRCYSYFNVTTNQIASDHSIDNMYLKVPSCTSETYAFYNHYALYIHDLSTAPTNYQQVLDNLAKNSDKYLYIYIGNQSEITNEYLVSQVLSNESAVQQYISSMNYAITLDNQYITAGKYGYIQLK